MHALTGADDLSVIEVRSDSDAWWSNTPWWFVSAGLHLVVLLIATLVSIERYMAVEQPPIIISAPLSATAPIQDLIRTVDSNNHQVIKHDESMPETDDKRIMFPNAEDGDHIETDNDRDDDHSAHGESLEFNSRMPGKAGGLFGGFEKNPGFSPIVGVGGGKGGGGPFGRPERGGDKNINPWGHRDGPPNKPMDDAVIAALKWLARHQNPDGSWGAVNHLNHCVGGKCAGVGDAEFDAGLTGLALLAYLGAGFTHLSKDELPDAMNPGRKLKFGDVVKSGLKWLMSKQDTEGCIGGRGPKFMYNHTIAALALSEAYGMSATQSFKGPAQQAIDFIVAAQNPDRAWRYTERSGDNDTSVTGWAVMALKSAEMSELTVPSREAYGKVRRWLDEATETSGYYRVGYNARNSGKVFVPGKNDSYVHHESMTAVGVLCRIFMMKDKKDPALAGVHLLVSDLPQTKADWTDYYYWYYGSLALFQYDGPKGPFWKKWEGAMKEALLPSQKTAKDGCANGSWTSEDERWGFEGGRVYATAINALTLEVYYRYPNVFRGDK